MAEWVVSGNVTLPPDADQVQIYWMVSDGSMSQYAADTSSSFSFYFDDTLGPEFFLIFVFLDSSYAVLDIAPVIHGPYVASDVGTPSGFN